MQLLSLARSTCLINETGLIKKYVEKSICFIEPFHKAQEILSVDDVLSTVFDFASFSSE